MVCFLKYRVPFRVRFIRVPYYIHWGPKEGTLIERTTHIKREDHGRSELAAIFGRRSYSRWSQRRTYFGKQSL